MKNPYILLIVLMYLNTATYGQNKNLQSSKSLSLTWEIIDSGYKNSAKTLSELTLENTSDKNFPSAGWDIYFNSAHPYELNQDTLNLKLTHINGSFFKLSPGQSFEGIAAGEALKIPLLTRALKNSTDYPKGFYIVYNNNSSKSVPLNVTNKLSVDYHVQERELARQIYEQNQKVENTNLKSLSPILPTPINFAYFKGNFRMDHDVKINNASDFKNEADYLAKELEKISGIRPQIATTGQKSIIVLQKKELVNEEAYELNVSPTKITISAATGTGIFYGIQSLKNMFPPEVWNTKPSSFLIPAICIKDAPRFAHRAFMMDIARNFLPKEQILKTLDVLSLYKINVFHLHFTDDEGWRIEIKGLPELTEVGAKRGHTIDELDHLIPAYGSGPEVNNSSESGYLSRADFIEILKYATQRHIAVIPEYETPGHARAAIKSMDARYHRLMKEGEEVEAKKFLLRDINDQSKYESVQGFKDNVINPALPSVYNFIEKIIDETVTMYKEANAPLKTIHFGGDEVPTGVWEKSSVAKDLIKTNKEVDSINGLWFYYFSKVNQLLKSRNLYLSGWEEIGLRKTEINGKKQLVVDSRFATENFHTDVWNNLSGNEDLAYKLANEGYKVILTNVTNMYLDLAYNKSYSEIGQYWGGYVDVDKPFSFIPYNYYKNQKENKFGEPLPLNFYDDKVKLTDAGKKNIIGLQAPLWSEIITSKQRFEYLLFPKILGLAERSWAADPDWATEVDAVKSEQLYQKAWSNFVAIIGHRELPKLDYYVGGFNYRIPTPGYIVENNLVKANILYPNLILKYTVDGSEPNVDSALYTSPIPFVPNMKLSAFNKKGRRSNVINVE
ncbi:MAG TPA: family 20 glycosylhydrolase [Pelobium sp.]|nr:family 20 glycosylhydrolase [Pelobium sp.]